MAKREEIRAMQDAWRAYLDLALGFTEASRKQATKVARRLVGKGGATADQLQGMAEDLVKTSLANRESLTRLVRFELDKALGRVGLATAEEVADLTSRVRDLEQRLRAAEATAAVAAVGTDGVTQPGAAAIATPVAEAAKAAPRKAGPAPAKTAAKAAAKAAPAPAPAKAAPVKKAAPAAGGAVVKKAAPAPAKKVVAKKAVAKKATGTPPA
jgi:polyhydroxyalkanoate synthesis regulator phasin